MNYLEKFQLYLEIEKNFSHNTVSAYLSDIQQFFRFINKTPEKIVPDDISAFLMNLHTKGVSVATANRKLSAIKTFFNAMLRKGIIDQNPAALIETAKTEQRLPHPIDEQTIEKLINAPDNLRDRTIMEILYATGIRREELVNIKINDIDFQEGSLRVIGKGNKERIIPLYPKVLMLIKELIQTHNSKWLFPGRKNNHLSTRQVNDIVKKWAQKIKQENITPHKFRHSFCSHLYKEGAELKVIQDLAGHASPNTTNLYTKVSNTRNRLEYLRFHPHAREKVSNE